MKDTKIEWCDHTFNPWIGCTKVSPGCAHCYAEALDKRTAGGRHWGKGVPRRRTSDSYWKQPEKWNREAQRRGTRPRVFCASLADWLDHEVPVEWLSDLLWVIWRTPNLDWLLLTKRPEHWRSRLTGVVALDDCGAQCAAAWLDRRPPTNLWLGTSTEDQERALERIPQLLQIPARVRFISAEPQLSPLHIHPAWLSPLDQTRAPWIEEQPVIDWVICGGESGPNARPMDTAWARSLRDQCQAAGMAFFMKQMGGTRRPFPPIPEDLLIRQFPNAREVASI